MRNTRNRPRADRPEKAPKPVSVVLSPIPRERLTKGTFSNKIHALRIELNDLIEVLKTHNLTELQIESGGQRIHLRRETASGPTFAVTAATAFPVVQESHVESLSVPTAGEKDGYVTITSPIVGTFYRSHSPEADPYVEVGDIVKKGQILCIVEAMKLMNEIESEVDGRVEKVLAESTKPVEYGQPLFLIDPAPAS